MSDGKFGTRYDKLCCHDGTPFGKKDTTDKILNRKRTQNRVWVIAPFANDAFIELLELIDGAELFSKVGRGTGHGGVETVCGYLFELGAKDAP